MPKEIEFEKKEAEASFRYCLSRYAQPFFWVSRRNLT